MVQEGEPLTTDLSLKAEVRLYYDVYAPGAEPAPLLLALHGYGSNKGWMMREARQHVPEGFAVAALQGPHQHMKEPREQGGPLRYGFGWLTNFRPEESVALHQRAVLDLVASLVAQGVARRVRLPPGLLAVVRAQLPLRLHAPGGPARRRRHLRRHTRRLGDEPRLRRDARLRPAPLRHARRVLHARARRSLRRTTAPTRARRGDAYLRRRARVRPRDARRRARLARRTRLTKRL